MQNKKVFSSFFKRYGYYLLLIACVLALAFIITFSVINNDNNATTPVNTPSVITFSAPVLNGTIIKEYSNTELQYNQTLKQWEAHLAVDFTGASGSDVVACYDGKVSEVYNNTLEGNVIKIDHGSGLVSVYKSLGEISLTEGTVVKQGDLLGKISTSASRELKDGEHVHFEVWKDGSRVDPSNYLNLTNK